MNRNQPTVSELDKQHLVIIRDTVRAFVAECAKRFDQQGSSLLDIAPQVHEGAKPFFVQSHILTLDIDPRSGADFVADLCQDNSNLIGRSFFDFVVCTEVLEHTLNPFRAVEEMFRVLKPGGLLFLTVPFNFRIHGPLPDCWRFTEHGLRSVLSSFCLVELRETPTPGRDLMPIQYQVIARKP
jgi:SAM-dependent methyltransferase